MTKKIAFLIVFLLFGSNVALAQKELRGKLVPPPDECETGYEKGVSAQFCYFDRYRMIVCGGANFPKTAAAQGGEKTYYKGIYALENDSWCKIGELPDAAAFEAFIVAESSNMVITNALQKRPSAYKVVWDTIRINSMGDFPKRMEQPLVVSDSDYLYVWGGFTFAGDILLDEWKNKSVPLPGVPVGGWKICRRSGVVSKISAPPIENLTGATAVCYKDGYLIVGGVNRAIFEAALVRRQRMKSAQGIDFERLKFEEAKYMSMSPAQYKFNDKLLFYNPKSDKWQTLGRSQHLARAGAAVVVDNHQRLIVAGGELKPGIRNPQTWIFDLGTLP